MQRRLINHRAGQECIAILFQQDGQPPKPFSPLMTQKAPDPDFIDHWPAGLITQVAFVRRILNIHDDHCSRNFVLLSHREDDVALFVPGFDLPVRFGRLFKGVAAVNDYPDLAGFDEPLDDA